MRIERFRGPYFFLSNFYPIKVQLEGIIYPTVEHGYQAAKTLNSVDRLRIRDAESPSAAKRLGHKAAQRPDWGRVKLPVMRHLLEQKFNHPDLKNLLLSTGDAEIIEGNTWGDTFWGVCNGVGSNHLGMMLMEIRQAHKGKE